MTYEMSFLYFFFAVAVDVVAFAVAVVRCQLAGCIVHCISSCCLIFPLAHLLIYYVFRRHHAVHRTLRLRLHLRFSLCFATVATTTVALAQVALDAIIQPTKTTATCAVLAVLP